MSVKIGFVSDRSLLQDRLHTLQCGSPLVLTVAATMDGERSTEQSLHKKFAHERYHGEWFRLTPELCAFIEENARPYLSGFDRLNLSAPVRTMRRRPRRPSSEKKAATPRGLRHDIDAFLDAWTSASNEEATPASAFQECLAAHWAMKHPGKGPPSGTALGRALGERYEKAKTGGRQCYFASLKRASAGTVDHQLS